MGHITDATILDEIASNDGSDYQYIMAVVRDNNPEPELYILLLLRC